MKLFKFSNCHKLKSKNNIEQRQVEQSAGRVWLPSKELGGPALGRGREGMGVTGVRKKICGKKDYFYLRNGNSQVKPNAENF